MQPRAAPTSGHCEAQDGGALQAGVLRVPNGGGVVDPQDGAPVLCADIALAGAPVDGSLTKKGVTDSLHRGVLAKEQDLGADLSTR